MSRHIEKRFGCFPNALVFGILCHTDYQHPSAFNLNALAKRIPATPIHRGHCFIHNGYQNGLFVIGACEFAAGHQRDAHGPKIARSDFVVLRGGLFLRQRLISIHGNRRRRIASISQWRDSREGCRLDAGQGLHAIHQLVLKVPGALRIISGRHQIDSSKQHSVRRKTRAGRPDFLQALQQQPCSDQQNETQRHLDQHQAGADPRCSPPPHDTPRFRFQGCGKIDLAGLRRGNQPHHKRREQANPGAKH